MSGVSLAQTYIRLVTTGRLTFLVMSMAPSHFEFSEVGSVSSYTFLLVAEIFIFSSGVAPWNGQFLLGAVPISSTSIFTFFRTSFLQLLLIGLSS